MNELQRDDQNYVLHCKGSCQLSAFLKILKCNTSCLQVTECCCANQNTFRMILKPLVCRSD